MDVTPVGVIFRGAPRRTDITLVNQLVQQRLAAHASLAKQLRLFMVRDPTSFTIESPTEIEIEIATDDEIIEPLEPVFLALPAMLEV